MIDALKYTLLLLASYCGAIAGIVIAAMAMEELSYSGKYFRYAKQIIFGILMSMFFYSTGLGYFGIIPGVALGLLYFAYEHRGLPYCTLIPSLFAAIGFNLAYGSMLGAEYTILAFAFFTFNGLESACSVHMKHNDSKDKIRFSIYIAKRLPETIAYLAIGFALFLL